MEGQSSAFFDLDDLDDLDDFNLEPLLTHILHESAVPASDIIDVDALPDDDDVRSNHSSSDSDTICSSPAMSPVYSDVSEEGAEVRLAPSVHEASAVRERVHVTSPPPCVWAPGPSSLRPNAPRDVGGLHGSLPPEMGLRRVHMAVVSGDCACLLLTSV